MTTLIAIESSTELASVALLHQGQLSSVELDSLATHSAGILPALQQLLQQAGLTVQDCDALAFGCGPGAFTGLRTATGIIQGLAFAADLPVIPVVTLQAMALAALDQAEAELNDNTLDLLCVLDARMKEVYSAAYRYQSDTQSWQELQAPALSALSEIKLNPATILVCGQGLDVAALPAMRQIQLMPHARYVARWAEREWLAGRSVAPELAQPLYLRNKIALTTEERLRQQPT